MDYQALKAADAALSPPIPDPAQAAAALSAQTIVSPPVAIDKKTAREPLFLGGYLSLWEKFGAQTLSSFSAPTAADQLILLVHTFHLTLTTTDVTSLDLRVAADWQNFLGKAGLLVTNGLLPQSVVDFWTGLRTPTLRPFANPAPTGADVIAARTQF